MRRVRMLVPTLWAALVTGQAGCGPIFPKCDDPKHPCPPVEPDYPKAPLDGGK